AVRQLKDRQELFVDGADVIRLGRHRFNINTQPLDLTLVLRDGQPYLHLTGTQYFEPVTDEDYLATRAVWDQEVVSENSQVYRAEYLAWRILESLEANAASGQGSVEDFLSRSEEQRLEFVREFMAQRYQDNYAKGLHDVDGARILAALAATHVALQLARYPPDARACAWVYWQRFCPEETRAHWAARLKAFGECNRLFPGHAVQQGYVAALQSLLRDFLRREPLYPEDLALQAGEYLYHELVRGDVFTVTREAEQIATAFQQHLVARSRDDAWSAARAAMAGHPASELELIRDWVRGFLQNHQGGEPSDAVGTPPLEEVAALLFCGEAMPRKAVEVASRHTLDGMRGAHARIQANTYPFDYLDFIARLRRFDRESVPRFEAYHRLKGQLLDRERARLKLEEFRPRVLSSFVRN
ncbi:MAG: hypothetical protein KIT22_20085, partial [Verrucomicrobiae bacterium]|nr:hypothetical protein [Verrucomicrobiae bacterium]